MYVDVALLKWLFIEINYHHLAMISCILKDELLEADPNWHGKVNSKQ